jgi:hypothetical protein
VPVAFVDGVAPHERIGIDGFLPDLSPMYTYAKDDARGVRA